MPSELSDTVEDLSSLRPSEQVNAIKMFLEGIDKRFSLEVIVVEGLNLDKKVFTEHVKPLLRDVCLQLEYLAWDLEDSEASQTYQNDYEDSEEEYDEAGEDIFL